ncbi:MAG: cation ABC transporter substrate-binding protein [Deltaproteobacteria bacterium]|nr:cation ABC transporter substrate-binding protein [Deltaproteobacteria bacterium]
MLRNTSTFIISPSLFLLILMAMSISLPSAWGKPLTIVTSIVPQEYFVERIAGPDARIVAMVRPGSSPASYEPSPEQMSSLAEASVFFAIGVPFEKAWLPRMRAANPNLLVVDMARDIRRRAIAGHGHEHSHANEIADPHVWLSPPLVRVMAQTIRDILQELDPDNSSLYAANYIDFIREINNLDLKIIDIFARTPSGNRHFLVFHPSWGYFAASYGLEQRAIEHHGKEPGPKDLADILVEARKHGIKVVFAQPEFSSRSTEILARDLGGQVVSVSPLSRDWPENLLQAAKAFSSGIR